MGKDYQIRTGSAEAAREIKASAHYAYILNGITLDGSKFAAEELVLEGQCLVKDNVSGKYEKYADGNASPAELIGANNITPADLSGLNVNTTVDIVYNGVAFTITNTQLKTISGASTAADVVDLVKNAVNDAGVKFDNVGLAENASSKLHIATDEGTGASLQFVINDGDNDTATVEGVFGLSNGASDTGSGAFPVGKSSPVILDESVKFKLDDGGGNPDVVVGQVIVHGAVYNGMLKNVTQAFKDKLAGAIRFV